MENINLTNYTILKEIGSGGMARVYLAEHKTLGHQVAVKILNKEFTFNPNIRRRFVEEAKKMVRLNHPNVVKVTDLVVEENTVAIVMEFVEGKTLAELSIERKYSDAEIENFLKQMLEALSYIHEQGLIHRDIKPSNFILSKEGQLKLTDFGISKSLENDSDYTQTSTSVSLGTPMYMSPEQVKSTKNVSHLTDIYSLGVVLWQLVSRKKPYDSNTTSFFDLQFKIVKEDLAKTNTKWDAFIQKATQKEEEKRFQSASEFLEALSGKEKFIRQEDDFEKTSYFEVPRFKESKTKLEEVKKKPSLRKKANWIIGLIALFIISFLVIKTAETNTLKSNKFFNVNKINEENVILDSSKNHNEINDLGKDTISSFIKQDEIKQDEIKENELNEVVEKKSKTISFVSSVYGKTEVLSVICTKKYTIVKLRTSGGVTGNWIQIKPRTYVYDKQNNKKMFLIDVYNISKPPEKRFLKYDNEIIDFELYFPALSKSCKTIDLIEGEDEEWKFYNLNVDRNEVLSDEEIYNKIQEGYQKVNDDDAKKMNLNSKSITFKNNSNISSIDVAIVFKEGNSWITEGWISVKSGQSKTIYLPDNYSEEYFYYTGLGKGLTWTKVGEKFCVDPELKFRYSDKINHPCSVKKVFSRKLINSSNTIVNLYF